MNLDDCSTKTNQAAKDLCTKNNEEQAILQKRYDEQHQAEIKENPDGRHPFGAGMTIPTTSTKPIDTQYINDQSKQSSLGIELFIVIIAAVILLTAFATYLILHRKNKRAAKS